MFKPVFAFHPGEDIWEELEARGWTQRQFADIIGISAPELNNIIKGKKNLTPALAVRIGEAFGTSAEVWMNMQVHYSLDLAKKEEIKRIWIWRSYETWWWNYWESSPEKRKEIRAETSDFCLTF